MFKLIVNKGLKNLVNELNFPAFDFPYRHNGGNDACYTLLCFLKLSMDSVGSGNESLPGSSRQFYDLGVVDVMVAIDT